MHNLYALNPGKKIVSIYLVSIGMMIRSPNAILLTVAVILVLMVVNFRPHEATRVFVEEERNVKEGSGQSFLLQSLQKGTTPTPGNPIGITGRKLRSIIFENNKVVRRMVAYPTPPTPVGQASCFNAGATNNS